MFAVNLVKKVSSSTHSVHYIAIIFFIVSLLRFLYSFVLISQTRIFSMFNTLKKSSLTLLIASTALIQFGCNKDSDPDKVGNWYKKGVPSFGGSPRNGAVSFMINNIGYIGTGYTSESVPRAKDFWSYDAAYKNLVAGCSF